MEEPRANYGSLKASCNENKIDIQMDEPKGKKSHGEAGEKESRTPKKGQPEEGRLKRRAAEIAGRVSMPKAFARKGAKAKNAPTFFLRN